MAVGQAIELLRRMFHRCHAKGVNIAIGLRDGNVFPRHKDVCAESITRFIIIGSRNVIIEDPSGMFFAPGLMHDESDFVRLSVPKSPHPAMIAILLPQVRIDMSLIGERRHELVAVSRRPGGKFL